METSRLSAQLGGQRKDALPPLFEAQRVPDTFLPLLNRPVNGMPTAAQEEREDVPPSETADKAERRQDWRVHETAVEYPEEVFTVDKQVSTSGRKKRKVKAKVAPLREVVE